MDDAELGSKVKKARESADVSARQVAKSIGMDPAAYARSEAGARAFKGTELVDIANRLDLPLDALVSRPAADGIAAGRRALAAGEAAIEAVTTWLSTLDRALALALPPEGLVAVPPESRAELHVGFAAMARTVMPRTATVTVQPGMRQVIDDVLRVELPRLVHLEEKAAP